MHAGFSFCLKVRWMSAADHGEPIALGKSETVATPTEIQPFAAMIAVTSDWVITHISANIGAFLDIDTSVLGHLLDQVLLDVAVHDIRGVLNATAGQNGMGRLLGCDLRHGYPSFDLTIHNVETGFILEIEPAEQPSKLDDIGLIRGLIDRVRQASSQQEVANKAARSLRALTGFDRVVVCDVGADGHVSAIAEASMPGSASFPSGDFFASDVLSHAGHQLNSQLCMTADIDATPIALLSKSGNAPLDLTHAISEAATPACLEFLRASGAQASFAVSIVHNGALVGLIICHHQKPLRTGFRTRMLVGLFADLFTYEFVSALPDNPR